MQSLFPYFLDESIHETSHLLMQMSDAIISM